MGGYATMKVKDGLRRNKKKEAAIISLSPQNLHAASFFAGPARQRHLTPNPSCIKAMENENVFFNGLSRPVFILFSMPAQAWVAAAAEAAAFGGCCFWRRCFCHGNNLVVVHAWVSLLLPTGIRKNDGLNISGGRLKNMCVQTFFDLLGMRTE